MTRRCISLFTGCGGLDLGLHRAGFRTIFANDIDQRARESFLRYFGTDIPYHLGSVSEVNADLIAEMTSEDLEGVDLLAGGPPCPPYSKSRFYRKDKPRSLDDPIADETLNGYVSLLNELAPRAFLFENVHGFAYKPHWEAHSFLKTSAEETGYRVIEAVLNAADFGVPQIRQRFFMIGIRGAAPRLPVPSHRDPSEDEPTLFRSGVPPWRTAGEAIADLDTEENASDKGHFAGGKYHDLLVEIPPGDNYLYFTKERGHPQPKFRWRSRYWSFLLKLSPDLPSWTIQARRSNNMGPLHWRNRILRIEEVKRLQTFPDDMALSGTLEQQWRQIGNAVPPLLAAALGREIASVLEESEG